MGDLSGLRASDRTEMEVMDLRGEPTGVILHVVGPYSDEVKEFQKENDKRRQRFNRRIGNARKLTAQQQEELNQLIDDAFEERLLVSVVGWHDKDNPDSEGIPWDGGVLEFSRENLAMLYKELPFLKDQVAAYILDEGNFTRAS